MFSTEVVLSKFRGFVCSYGLHSRFFAFGFLICTVFLGLEEDLELSKVRTRVWNSFLCFGAMNENPSKTASSSSLAMTEKRPQRPGGCVGIFFQLFDWNRRFAKKKLFSKKLLTPGQSPQITPPLFFQRCPYKMVVYMYLFEREVGEDSRGTQLFGKIIV